MILLLSIIIDGLLEISRRKYIDDMNFSQCATLISRHFAEIIMDFIRSHDREQNTLTDGVSERTPAPCAYFYALLTAISPDGSHYAPLLLSASTTAFILFLMPMMR